MRSTKIICTIGPSISNYESLLRMASLGMNIARLNMSHGDHEWHGEVIKKIKRINNKTDHSIAIMLDTKGPEVRTGDIPAPLDIKVGDKFLFTLKKNVKEDIPYTGVNYDGFVREVSVGDIILIDGGVISFRVVSKTRRNVYCECLYGGILGSRRHINIRGKSPNLDSITEKDWDDIEFGMKHTVDFLALSFVKNGKVVMQVRDHLKKSHLNIGIISKIESIDAISNLEEITELSDGIMVARGDLGSEFPFEEVPILQDRMVRLSRQKGKPVIVATQLLESMMSVPIPTRAEVGDISYAVSELADAVMLSGETAAGKYPFDALESMDKVVRRAEKYFKSDREKFLDVHLDIKDEELDMAGICSAAVHLAEKVGAEHLVVFTRRGATADILSRFRPFSNIYAFTNMSSVRRKLNLNWGISSYRIDFSSDPEKTMRRAMELLTTEEIIKKGDKVVALSDIKVNGKFAPTIQMRIVK